MKRTYLALSVFGVSALGCLAFSSTASAVAPGAWGPSPCAIAYDYCVTNSGNTQAYCWDQYVQCCEAGGACQQTAVAGKETNHG